MLQQILGFGVFHTSHFFSTLSEHQRLGFCKWVQRVYQFASLQKPWRKGIALWPLFTNQNSLVTLRSLCTIFVQPFFSGPEVSVQTSGCSCFTKVAPRLGWGWLWRLFFKGCWSWQGLLLQTGAKSKVTEWLGKWSSKLDWL